MDRLKILEDFHLNISQEDTFRQMDCHPSSPVYQEMQELFQSLKKEALNLCHPKGVLAFGTLPESYRNHVPVRQECIYALLTLGEEISQVSSRAFAEGDYVRGLMLDAMADAALFSLEEDLQRELRNVCRDWKKGISKRLEAPHDIPMEIHKDAFRQCRADRILQMQFSDGLMFHPLKSSCQIYLTTDDTSIFHAAHNCRKCPDISCAFRREPPLEVRIVSEHRTMSISYETGSLWEAIRKEVKGLSSPCGGKGICGKCAVQVLAGKLPVSEEDKKHFTKSQLEDGWRLACLAKPVENLTVRPGFPLESNIQAVADFSGCSADTFPAGTGQPLRSRISDYGFAIDLGTTTLAVQLISLENGRFIDTWVGLNGQREYGGDVISRIQASVEGKKEKLQVLILHDLSLAMEFLMKKNKLTATAIKQVALAGNTTMLHLLLGYPCDGLGHVPFTPWNTETVQKSAFALFSFLAEDTDLLIFPGISAFVGADIVSGIYGLDIQKQEENCLLVDLGTNGEMALRTQERFLVTSVAAGPAFEGGNIKWGTGSIPGAISGACFEDGALNLKTIQNKPPVGICGTGVLELTETFLKQGIIDETGRMDDQWFDSGYPLVPGRQKNQICLTQADIREIQLAKAAVRAGIEALLKRAGLTARQINHVYISGGFGYYLNYEKAISIGMFPSSFRGKIQTVGNSSLKGAVKLLLHPEEITETEKIVNISQEISLSADRVFQKEFMENMPFPDES